MTTVMLEPVTRARHSHNRLEAAIRDSALDQPATPPPSDPEQMRFGVAQNFEEVSEAWRLVYQVYHMTGLIETNPYKIHTPPCISSDTAVFHGRKLGETHSTLTAVVDNLDDPNRQGLPLDSVYRKELDGLRAQGLHLTEYGLFAHRGQILWENSWGQTRGTFDTNEPQKAACLKESLYELMRLAFFFGHSRGSTNFVIGVHPRHVRFYRRAFGFRQIGEQRRYPAVKDHPVVLLHGELNTSLASSRMPHALGYCMKNPIPESMFMDRFMFKPRGPRNQECAA